jgi:hypothetical protein
MCKYHFGREENGKRKIGIPEGCFFQTRMNPIKQEKRY